MFFMDPAPLPLWLQLVEAAFTCMKDAEKSGGNRASHEKGQVPPACCPERRVRSRR